MLAFGYWARFLPGFLGRAGYRPWWWRIEAFDEDHGEQRKLALFPADRTIPEHAREVGVQVQLSSFRLKRPRQWGACWTFCRLWAQLNLDEFCARIVDRDQHAQQTAARDRVKKRGA